jgi:hypothetical protein
LARYDGPAMTHNWRLVALRAFRLGETEIHETLPVAFVGPSRRDRGKSVLPEVPEAGGRKLGVANCVLDVLVPEVVL